MKRFDFRNWKKVYITLQGNIPKTALKKYCLQHKWFEGMKERTWANHCIYDTFTPIQKMAIWEYLELCHFEEIQKALEAYESLQVA